MPHIFIFWFLFFRIKSFRSKNEFSFTTPATGTVLTYQLATGKLEKQVEREIAGLKKINKENNRKTNRQTW